MEHIAALLLIVGCSPDLQQCKELPAPVPLYEAVEDCHAQMPPAVAFFEKTQPRVFAQCVEVDPALAEEDLELTWNVTAGGGLTASIGIPELRVASSRPEKDYLSRE